MSMKDHKFITLENINYNDIEIDGDKINIYLSPDEDGICRYAVLNKEDIILKLKNER